MVKSNSSFLCIIAQSAMTLLPSSQSTTTSSTACWMRPRVARAPSYCPQPATLRIANCASLPMVIVAAAKSPRTAAFPSHLRRPPLSSPRAPIQLRATWHCRAAPPPGHQSYGSPVGTPTPRVIFRSALQNLVSMTGGHPGGDAAPAAAGRPVVHPLQSDRSPHLTPYFPAR